MCPFKWLGDKPKRVFSFTSLDYPKSGNWVCSAITLRVKRCVEEIFNIDNKLLRAKSGQLPDLG
jgi:hypothetical protein